MKDAVDEDLNIAQQGAFLIIDEEPDNILGNGWHQQIQRVK